MMNINYEVRLQVAEIKFIQLGAAYGLCRSKKEIH